MTFRNDIAPLYQVIFEIFALPTAVLPCPAPTPSIGSPPDSQCLSLQMSQILIAALFQLSFYLRMFPSCFPYLIPDLSHQCPWLLSITVTTVTTGSSNFMLDEVNNFLIVLFLFFHITKVSLFSIGRKRFLFQLLTVKSWTFYYVCITF